VRAYIKGAFFYFVALTLPVALLLNLFITLLSDKIIKVSFLALVARFRIMDQIRIRTVFNLVQINLECDLSDAVSVKGNTLFLAILCSAAIREFLVQQLFKLIFYNYQNKRKK
jgi:hypothetical protein